MRLTMRAYEGEDYWRVRESLRKVFRANGGRELSWQVYRWDYCRWHVAENCEGYRFEEVVSLWETRDGRLAAVLNPEGPGEAFLQVHPAWRTPCLEEEMVAVAEERLSRPGPGGRRQLTVWAHAHDAERQALLHCRGYTRGDWPEYQRYRPLALPVPERPLPPGYTVRSLGGPEDLPARSWASWKGFHPGEPDDHYEGWTWYLNVQRAPLYRRDLDVVALAPGGEIASFCTVWFDGVTRTGAFEPVATVPAHLRRDLASAVMDEGLRRLQRLGATMAYVGSYSQEAGALYASVGFTEYELSERWVREW